MITFTKTRSAADYISHHTSSDLTRSRALVLLKRLGVAEAALAATDGDPGLVHSLLRGLVLTVRDPHGSPPTPTIPTSPPSPPWATHPPRHPPASSTNSSPGCYGPASPPPCRYRDTPANRPTPGRAAAQRAA